MRIKPGSWPCRRCAWCPAARPW